MTTTEVVTQLKGLGSDSYKRILMNHGAKELVLGVKIGDLKKLQQRIKSNYPLALELYDTGIYDAQYLAGLVTDDGKMTKKDLRHWLAKANCPAISGSTVAWVAAESRYGDELAAKWNDAKKEATAHAGWMTLSSLVAIKNDSDLDLTELQRLLHLVDESIQQQPNLVRYAMNGFIIAVGTYVPSLTNAAIQVAQSIGIVSVDMGDTACEVPSAVSSIQKVQKRGAVGKKRKTARC